MRRTLHILILLLVLDLVGAGALWYGYSFMHDKKTGAGGLTQELVLEKQRGERLSALRGALESSREDHLAIEEYLFDPSEENQIAFLSILEGMGLPTTGAAIAVTSFELTKDAPRKIRADMTVTGTWGQQFHVLRLIESLPTRTAVERFSIRRAQTTPNAPDAWQGNIAFEILSIASTPN